MVRKGGFFVLTGMPSPVLGEFSTTSIKDFTIFPPHKKIVALQLVHISQLCLKLSKVSDFIANSSKTCLPGKNSLSQSSKLYTIINKLKSHSCLIEVTKEIFAKCAVIRICVN